VGIIIFGASGAGSTTLGREIARRLKYQFLDIDDYLWCWSTKIPLTVTRSQEERTRLLMDDIKKYPNFVISGTIFSDRELFEPLLNLAVFITSAPAVCAERVRIREHARWGKRVLPGGDMYKATRFHGDVNDYVANALKYESADVSTFSRRLHEQWIADLQCPVLRVGGTNGISQNADWVISQFIRTIE